MIYDVIVVGSGAGGSSAASFLARQGISTLLLDKSAFPRDTVRSDGLMPQAVYWLDRLGCANEVLAETKGCIKACDLFVDGEHLLTGRFPDDTIYPDFAILIVRQRFDSIVLQNAIAHGARFEGKTIVRGIERDSDCVRVLAEADRRPVEYRGRIVIGADGVSSAVSRAIGNTLKDGVLGVSVRTTYRDVACGGAQIRAYFNRDYFPGYGWLFVDDHGSACAGLGYAFDKNFPMVDNLGSRLRRFIETDLADVLAGATRCGPFSGGISGYYRPKSIVADRVMLIGDAANQTDPLNRGGIHTAMESAYCATEACRHALSVGDFSRDTLRRYEAFWSAQFEPDWRTSEIFMSIARNPNLNELSLFLIKQIGKLTAADPQFRKFAGGVFSGVLSQSAWLSPGALYHAFPKDPNTWHALVEGHDGAALGSMRLARETLATAASAAVRMARRPIANLDWGMEVATKVLRFAERRVAEAANGNRI